MSTSITIDQVTNGSTQGDKWIGTGIFDALMEAVNENIKIQYDNNRITGSDYANVYLGSLQSVIAESIQFALQKPSQEAQTDKLKDDLLTAAKQRAELEAQTALIQAKIQAEQDSLLTAAKQRAELEAQTALIQAKIAGEQYNTGHILPNKALVLEAQKNLYNRQRLSFDDHKYQKIFEAQLNYNGMIYADAGENAVFLNVGGETYVADIYNKIINPSSSVQQVQE